MTTVFALLAAALLAPADAGLIEWDSRWQSPQYLGFRPADGRVSDTNPPRFSWPYNPQVVNPEQRWPRREFRLQVAAEPTFTEPAIDRQTSYNFENAFAPLALGRWLWRVGYLAADGSVEVWSATRSFDLDASSVVWDRTVIDRAAELLSARPHPRLGPPDGDWAGWAEQLQARPETRRWLEVLLTHAQRQQESAWWKDLPATDRRGETPYEDRDFARMGRAAALSGFAWRFTGDSSHLRGKELLLQLCRFPRGGLASPEYHGPSTKWPTQLNALLPIALDVFWPDLTAAERAEVLAAVDWRLRATYLERASWAGPDNTILRNGVAGFTSSHPYENFFWSLPGVLLTVGDLPVADELLPLGLNYLTGVTSAHGPDEGWNEGLAYGSFKAGTMLEAANYVNLLLPELELGRSPYFARLGDWLAHMLPLGLQHTSFGDYARGGSSHTGAGREAARLLAWLTGLQRFADRVEACDQVFRRAGADHVWLNLLADERTPPTAGGPAEARQAVFTEAGWVMTASHQPSDVAGWPEASGVIFQCRPRGGWSHSYRAEGDFVWYALGQTLTSVTGSTAYPDPHARHSMSHNVLMIDGVGQEWNPVDPVYPIAGRLLAFRTGERFVHWVGDATMAYQTEPRLARWLRHMVFIDQRHLVIFDDVALAAEATPARLSWLYQIADPTELDTATSSAAWRYTLGDVTAAVSLAGEGLTVTALAGREAYRNPITGDDLFAETSEKLAGKGRELPESAYPGHTVWVTTEPTRERTFLAAMVAWRAGGAAVTAAFAGETGVTVSDPATERLTVSFDPARPGDVTIDPTVYRDHFAATRPAPLK